MKNKAIIYLHGFNSASLDLHGNLLTSKDKLLVMRDFCLENDIVFYSPNIDYRDFRKIVDDILFKWNEFLDQDHEVIFMGSSMGGFASGYLAMKTGAKAIMINPVVSPTELLPRFIGVTANQETGQSYDWNKWHCDQYLHYEQELADCKKSVDRTVLLDRGDELLDAEKTQLTYRSAAKVFMYEDGSHGFDHMRQALPVVEGVIFS